MLTWLGLALCAIAAPPADFAATLDRLCAQAPLPGARIGIVVQSLGDGAFWYTQRPGEDFIPASNAKLAVAAIALEHLGPAFTFTTRIWADGVIEGDVLHGDLILQGGGDPTLTPEMLTALARALAQGDAATRRPPIRTIRGRLLLDESFFPRSGPLREGTWERADLPWYYAAPASSLAIAGNAVTVTVRGGALGTRPTVILSPPTALLQCTNRAITRENAATLRVLPQGWRVILKGAIAPGKEIRERVSVPDPARLVTELWRSALTAAGVTVLPIPLGSECARGPRRQLLEHKSAPISELVAHLLKTSDNHYAEQFRWTLLSYYSREVPLDRRYPALIEDFLAHNGLVRWGLELVDGSGLSRANRMSPLGATRILINMLLTPSGNAFSKALPVGGEDGTLMSRFQGTPAAGNVRAKTGTMRGVSTLSGYVTTRRGEPLVFAIFCNDVPLNGLQAARALQDAIVCEMARQK